MRDEKQLLATDVAAALGIAPSDWRARVTKGRAPQPDGHHDLRTPYWYASTVAAYRHAGIHLTPRRVAILRGVADGQVSRYNTTAWWDHPDWEAAGLPRQRMRVTADISRMVAAGLVTLDRSALHPALPCPYRLKQKGEQVLQILSPA